MSPKSSTTIAFSVRLEKHTRYLDKKKKQKKLNTTRRSVANHNSQ